MSIGDWTLSVTGEIVRVDREDIDKSGKNPKFNISFVLRPSAVEGVPAGAIVPDEIPIRVRDRELSAMTKATLEVGDCVVMQAKTNGPKPSVFNMTAVEKA